LWNALSPRSVTATARVLPIRVIQPAPNACAHKADPAEPAMGSALGPIQTGPDGWAPGGGRDGDADVG